VPAGRIPNIDPPYTWEQCAEDAVYNVDRLQGGWDDLQIALDKIELYNGSGYRRQGINSPYLWSGTTLYSRGKYVEDGRFSAAALDQQLGCSAILKRMIERGVFE
jgi:lysozyme family protein